MDLEANDQLDPSSQNLSTVIALRLTAMCYATRCAALRPTPHCVSVHSCNTTQKRGPVLATTYMSGAQGR